MIDWQRFREKIDLNIFKNIFTNCLEVGQEKVLIVGDYGKSSRIIAPILTNAYALAAREMDLNYSVFLQHSKVRGDFADEVLINMLRNLPPRSVIVLNVSNRIGRLGRIGNSFRKFCRENNHKYITSSSLGALSNESLKIVLKTLDVNYKDMHARGERIKSMLDSGREVNIRTAAGTDLTMDISKSTAVINSGVYTKVGAGGNMPAGEVYIPPMHGEVNGTMMIDGSIRLRDKTMLVKNPVKIDIVNGSITGISSNYEGNLFKETLEWAHRKSKNPLTIRKISELGIGINPNASIIGATIIDEKTMGTVHVANGSNAWFGGDIKSLVHLDHVIKKAVVRVDGRLMKLF